MKNIYSLYLAGIINEERWLVESQQPQQPQQPQRPQQQQQPNFQELFYTVLNDINKLQQDADAIVQGTKTQNSDTNKIIRTLAREVRDGCIQMNQKIRNYFQ